MKVKLERDECISCASCWSLCPVFFQANPDDDLVQIVQEYRIDDDIAIGQAPLELEQGVREAAELCPVQVIQV